MRCSVRNCLLPLGKSDDGMRCEAGHHFNQARQGYWNLTQPQDSKSSNPGDCDAAVEARSSWLERGHMNGFVEKLKSWLELYPADRDVMPLSLELGCGEGSISAALFEREAIGYCGIDLSKRAIKLAARRLPAATWVLANADRTLPVPDHSVDRVLSLFGRRPTAEIARVLRPGGVCIVAVPGAQDLAELREQVQLAATTRSRLDAVESEMLAVGLRVLQREIWTHQVQLDSAALSSAMAMTYRAVRHSQQSRLSQLTEMTVTLQADLIALQNG